MKAKFITESIGVKVLLYILAFAMLVTIATASFHLYKQYSHEVKELHTSIDRIHKSYLPSLNTSMWEADFMQMELMVDGISKLPHMNLVEIRSEDDHVLISAGDGEAKHTIAGQFPLSYRYNGKEVSLGTLRLIASLDDIYNNLIASALFIFLEDGLKALLISSFMLLIFHLMVTRHLKVMAKYVESIDFHKGKEPLVLNRAPAGPFLSDELEEVVSAINEMRDHLYDSYEQLEDINLFLQQDIERRRAAEEKAKKAEQEWEKTFNAISDIVTIQDTQMRILRVNRAACEAFQAEPEDLIGKFCYQVFRGETKPCADCPEIQAIFHTKGHSAEIEHHNLNKTFLVSAFPVFSNSGEMTGVVHIAKDVTEQKQLKNQFLQAQKMESIGRLAGGIAHDFNNILTAMLGYCQICMHDINENSPMWKPLTIIKNSGERAAALTSQLLAFSRKQPLIKRVVNISIVVNSMTMMLRRVIRENIILEIQTEADCKNIEADISQIEQILMNLAVNARDAMPDGGTLLIKTENIFVDEKTARKHKGMKSNSYVRLTVQDDGIGMTPEVKEKIFEPFFTTKQFGDGTGLGLATVYGLVKQHQGYIAVESEPVKGATFEIYLPVTKEKPKKLEEQGPASLQGGEETIMVVEDDLFIRGLLVDSLQPLGYKILAASSGDVALSMSETYEGAIDLFLVDVIMPGMNGIDLAGHLEEKRPDARIIFMSGYTNDVIKNFETKKSVVHFIQKPLILNTLTSKIRTVLNQSYPLN